jgi:hypothetical protein
MLNQNKLMTENQINFGERILKAGIHRVVNGLPEHIDLNAKRQRRRDATQAGHTACL